nr:hypothetical protein [Moorella thermoacetica]
MARAILVNFQLTPPEKGGFYRNSAAKVTIQKPLHICHKPLRTVVVKRAGVYPESHPVNTRRQVRTGYQNKNCISTEIFVTFSRKGRLDVGYPEIYTIMRCNSFCSLRFPFRDWLTVLDM